MLPAVLALAGCYADTSGAGAGLLGMEGAGQQTRTDAATAGGAPPGPAASGQVDETIEPVVEPEFAGPAPERDAGAPDVVTRTPEDDSGAEDPFDPPPGTFPPGGGAPAGARVGDPCKRDDDCSALLNGFSFAEGICLTEDEGFPGGSCSALCDAPTFFCGDGASCIEGVCQPTCDRDADCRQDAGYRCDRTFFSSAPGTCEPT